MAPRRIPTILAVVTLGLATIVALPTALLGGPDALVMMAIGAAASLATVVGAFWLAQLAFRGPDRFATKLVVGGFVTRMILLFAIAATLVIALGLEPSGFVLWMVAFYFAQILVEAWILARQPIGADR